MEHKYDVVSKNLGDTINVREMGHCISVEQKLRRSPTILNLQQTLSTGDLHLIRVTSFRRKIAPLFADIHLLRDRENGADFVLRYHFHLISNFHMLFILKSAPCRLTPNEALPQTPLRALP